MADPTPGEVRWHDIDCGVHVGNFPLSRRVCTCDLLIWDCGPHTNVWKGHDARCRQVPKGGS